MLRRRRRRRLRAARTLVTCARASHCRNPGLSRRRRRRRTGDRRRAYGCVGIIAATRGPRRQGWPSGERRRDPSRALRTATVTARPSWRPVAREAYGLRARRILHPFQCWKYHVPPPPPKASAVTSVLRARPHPKLLDRRRRESPVRSPPGPGPSPRPWPAPSRGSRPSDDPRRPHRRTMDYRSSRRRRVPCRTSAQRDLEGGVHHSSPASAGVVDPRASEAPVDGRTGEDSRSRAAAASSAAEERVAEHIEHQARCGRPPARSAAAAPRSPPKTTTRRRRATAAASTGRSGSDSHGPAAAMASAPVALRHSRRECRSGALVARIAVALAPVHRRRRLLALVKVAAVAEPERSQPAHRVLGPQLAQLERPGGDGIACLTVELRRRMHAHLGGKQTVGCVLFGLRLSANSSKSISRAASSHHEARGAAAPPAAAPRQRASQRRANRASNCSSHKSKPPCS